MLLSLLVKWGLFPLLTQRSPPLSFLQLKAADLFKRLKMPREVKNILFIFLIPRINTAVFSLTKLYSLIFLPAHRLDRVQKDPLL